MFDFVWFVLALLVISVLAWRVIAGRRVRRAAHEQFRKQGFRLVDKATPVKISKDGPDVLASVGEQSFRVKRGGWEPLERKEAA